MSLPHIASVPTLDTKQRAAILDVLFEPSTQLHTLSVDLLHTKTFESYYDLIASIGVQLSDLADSSSASDTEWLDSILGAHPRLGAAKVDSTQSQAEQAQLQAASEVEAEKLRSMNERYEASFTSLRFVTFVDGRSRSQIVSEMQQRINRNDIGAERSESIKAICDIAADRARKLLS